MSQKRFEEEVDTWCSQNFLCCPDALHSFAFKTGMISSSFPPSFFLSLSFVLTVWYGVCVGTHSIHMGVLVHVCTHIGRPGLDEALALAPLHYCSFE